MTDKQDKGLKQVAISILIGASVSFLTVLFQGILDYLHQLGPAVPGVVVGIMHSMRNKVV